MKKAALTSLLLLAVASSLVAGTLANYTIAIDIATGSLVAKKFIFIGKGTDSFQKDVKIAPSETVNWQFGVQNYDGSLVTETDMYYKLTFYVLASEDKEAIKPLCIAVNGILIPTVNGTGTYEVIGEFPQSDTGQYSDFAVEIHWPSDGANDIDFAGKLFGTTVRIDAVASQAPFDIQEPDSDIHVLYKITETWNQGGTSKFSYAITITNNSDQPISNWDIVLSLDSNRLDADGPWNAIANHDGLPEGTYRFYYPSNDNNSILPGQSVTFTEWVNSLWV